jgi:hypothetical protein
VFPLDKKERACSARRHVALVNKNTVDKENMTFCQTRKRVLFLDHEDMFLSTNFASMFVTSCQCRSSCVPISHKFRTIFPNFVSTACPTHGLNHLKVSIKVYLTFGWPSESSGASGGAGNSFSARSNKHVMCRMTLSADMS